ncbi:neuralized-like protein 4 [Microplitis demolitor]|uniref:neuralized-like protein 4 n=1 Tax=Microplitis demolitor TaxID=69319 RepID=UPI0004CDC9EA|nr:neuralized-like protein 4 [Microplitis demolitor]
MFQICGEGVILLNNNCTASRICSMSDEGRVMSSEPLKDDELFEVRIDKKIRSRYGKIEIGVCTNDPETMRTVGWTPSLQLWMMSNAGIVHTTNDLKEHLISEPTYGSTLDTLEEGHTIGVMRTSNSELVFFINGISQGVAATNVPTRLYALVAMFFDYVQVTITNPKPLVLTNEPKDEMEINNDFSMGEGTSTSMVANLNVNLNVNMNVNLPKNPSPAAIREDRLRFHERVGTLVKLSNNARTAERRRPLDEFNNGVVMTHRPLRDNELFEIRIDRLVDKWSGSIEVGVTTHSPTGLKFPATMTNMRSGTTMMSGCGILTNGKGIQREYGDINLDELREGDRVGMIRRCNGNLHYLINGLDQGVAAKVPPGIWGVVELYGMTVKVTIVDRDEREEQNLVTRRNNLHLQGLAEVEEEDTLDRLTFHPCCGTHADVINNGRTAHRPNAMDDFNNGVVLTMRPLRLNELFEVRLDKIVTKWAGSIEIGVTTHSPTELEFPFTMTNVRSGTWIMTGNGVMHNGTSIIDQYGQNLDRLQVGDRVGVMRKDNGTLHFFVNGTDQGAAAIGVPERVYGVIDLYGQATQATIVDNTDFYSPTTNNSSFSNTTLYSDLRFHHVHGKHARISNNGLTASRIRALGEFNEAIVIANRPLRDGELFEVSIDKMVGRWSGAIEAGVTAIRPDELEFPSTMTDIDHDTWMLSGSTVMRDGVTLRHHYSCDLDKLVEGNRIGMMRCADSSLHYYLDGVDQGTACSGLPPHVYPVIDLYAQCAQVTIVQPERRDTITQQYLPSENSISQQPTSVIQPQAPMEITHKFHESVGLNIQLNTDRVIAARCREYNHAVLLSESGLENNELFEISIQEVASEWSGSLKIGVVENTNGNWLTSMDLVPGMTSIPADAWYLTGNEVRYKGNVLCSNYCPSLDWLRVGDKIGVKRSHEGNLKFYINGEDMGVAAVNVPEMVWVAVELFGSTVAVSITSSKQQIPVISPNASLRLQDSLELLLDPMPLTMRNDGGMDTSVDASEAKLQEILLTPTQPVVTSTGETDWCYEFHENRGRNVELEGQTVARRVASYNQGVVMTNRPLIRGKIFQVEIEKINDRWVSGILCGVTCISPEKATFPLTALGFKKYSWIICSDWMSHNGTKVKTRYGANLDNLQPGSTVGLLVDEDSRLHLFVNGSDQGVAATDLPPYVYAVIDLYGQVEQVSIIGPIAEAVLTNNDAINLAIANNVERVANELEDVENSREKADLECHEKENVLEIPSSLPLNLQIDDDELTNFNAIQTTSSRVNPLETTSPNIATSASTAATHNNITHFNNDLPGKSMASSCNSDSNNSTSELEISNDPRAAGIECFKFKNNNINNPDDTYDNNTMSNNDLDNDDDDNHDNDEQVTNGMMMMTCSLRNNDCTNVEINNATNINIKNGSAASSSNMSSLNTAINSMNANNAINESILSNGQLNNIAAFNQNSNNLNVNVNVNVNHNNINQDNSQCNLTSNITSSLAATSFNTSINSTDLQTTNRQLQTAKQNSNSAILPNQNGSSHNSQQSLSSTRTSSSPPTPLNSTIIMTPSKKCEYLKACMRLKKSLVLPDEFFSLDEVTCYCNSCYKVDGDGAICKKGDPPAEFAVPVGWVRFPLKQTINANQIPQSTTDKWHVAYYGTRLDSIRWILDRGELLPMEQLDTSNLTTIINTENQNPQVVFSPNIKYVASEGIKKYPYIDMQSNRKLNASTAFQLLVRPGSYTMGADKQHGADGAEPTEWATKEAGATVIIALLINLDEF